MKVYVVKETLYSATTTFEVEVPDGVLQADRVNDDGSSPVADFVIQAELSGRVENLDRPAIPDNTPIEFVSTDYMVYDRNYAADDQDPEPIAQWDIS